MDVNDPHLNTGQYDPRTYWDARAQTSDGNIHQAVCVFRYSDDLNLAAERVQRHFLTRMLSKVDLQTKEVLEIGCGVARWLDLIESLNGRYSGVDISNEMIELAKARRPSGKFTQITGTEIPYPDNSFDFVFSITVLHHNSFEQQDLILKEAIRVLKNGGHLLLMEDIVHDQTQRLSFNMFLRTFEDWVRAATITGRMRFVSAKFARWWFLADRAERALCGLHRVLNPRTDTAFRRTRTLFARLCTLVVRIANAIDILIQPLLPRRLAVNAVMLFEKTALPEKRNGA